MASTIYHWPFIYIHVINVYAFSFLVKQLIQTYRLKPALAHLPAQAFDLSEYPTNESSIQDPSNKGLHKDLQWRWMNCIQRLRLKPCVSIIHQLAMFDPCRSTTLCYTPIYELQCCLLYNTSHQEKAPNLLNLSLISPSENRHTEAPIFLHYKTHLPMELKTSHEPMGPNLFIFLWVFGGMYWLLNCPMTGLLCFTKGQEVTQRS